MSVHFALQKFHSNFNKLPIKMITRHSALTKLSHELGLSFYVIRYTLKVVEFNIKIEYRQQKQNLVAVNLFRTPILENDEDICDITCCMLTVSAIKIK